MLLRRALRGDPDAARELELTAPPLPDLPDMNATTPTTDTGTR